MQNNLNRLYQEFYIALKNHNFAIAAEKSDICGNLSGQIRKNNIDCIHYVRLDRT